MRSNIVTRSNELQSRADSAPMIEVPYAVTLGWSGNHRSPQISRLPLSLKLSNRVPLHTR
jgi:hypothetical protein